MPLKEYIVRDTFPQLFRFSLKRTLLTKSMTFFFGCCLLIKSVFFPRSQETEKKTRSLHCWNCRGPMYRLFDCQRCNSLSWMDHTEKKKVLIRLPYKEFVVGHCQCPAGSDTLFLNYKTCTQLFLLSSPEIWIWDLNNKPQFWKFPGTHCLEKGFVDLNLTLKSV